MKNKKAPWAASFVCTAVLSLLLLAGGACSRKMHAISSTPSPSVESSPGVCVKIDTGLVSGETKDGVRVFRGIPYAAPPTGELRWKPPQPAKPWEGVRACTSFSSSVPSAETERLQ